MERWKAVKCVNRYGSSLPRVMVAFLYTRVRV